jgi:hypothetical protein
MTVRLAAQFDARRFALTGVAIVGVLVGAVALFLAADTESGEATEQEFTATALTTTTTTTTTTTAPPDGAPAIDVTTFGTEPPAGLVPELIFDLLTAQGATPQQAVCVAETLEPIGTELLALGAEALDDPRVEQTALDCTISPEIIEATRAAGLTG